MRMPEPHHHGQQVPVTHGQQVPISHGQQVPVNHNQQVPINHGHAARPDHARQSLDAYARNLHTAALLLEESSKAALELAAHSPSYAPAVYTQKLEELRSVCQCVQSGAFMNLADALYTVL